MSTTIRQPKVTVNILPASTTVDNADQKILFVGQMTDDGTATAGALVENIGNDGEEDTYFGANSMLAYLIRMNKERNESIQVDAIALADNDSGVAATGSYNLSGTATEDETLTFVYGSENEFTVDIAVAEGDTAEEIGDSVVSEINDDDESPVTASNSSGTVTLTAVNAGTYGNSIPLEIDGSVAGITTSVTGMSGGTVDPDTEDVFDVIGNERYQAIVWPYPEDTDEVVDFLDDRFNADGQVLDGVAFTAINDTSENLTSLGEGLNSQSLVIFGGSQETETNYSGGDIVEIPMVKAAQFAGYRGLRLDIEGYSISDLVITANGPLDSYGGPALASKPYFNTPFDSLETIDVGRGFDNTTIEDLKDAGISVLGNNISANAVICGEIVTTYKNDSAGNEDTSFLYLNYVDTSSQAREYFFNNLRSRFAQSRLTEGDTLKGRDMANSNTIRSYLKRLYQDLSGVDYVLLESGEDALNYFDENLEISIDKEEGEVTISMVVPLVTQLRTIEASMQIAFSTDA
jgi:phage tail sheath gpL-like